MPTAAMRYCSAPGCRELCFGGRCDSHPRRTGWRDRPSPYERGYDANYRRLRPQILARDPICTICGNAPSEEVDHIVPLSKGGENTADNLRGTCSDCNHMRGTKTR